MNRVVSKSRPGPARGPSHVRGEPTATQKTRWPWWARALLVFTVVDLVTGLAGLIWFQNFF